MKKKIDVKTTRQWRRRVRTHLKAGPADNRREFVHVGQFNFIVEIEG